MAFNRYKYFKNGFLDLSKLNFKKEDIKKYVIPLEYEGRPDLISMELYGDTSYQTLLIYLNRIKNSPEGFKRGVVLKYVNKNLLE